jgi:hypothetical protein
MSEEKAKNKELTQKLVDFLKAQTTQVETKDILQGLGLKNAARHRNLIRKLARADKQITVEVVNKRLRFWYGAKKPPEKPEEKAKLKKEAKPKKERKKRTLQLPITFDSLLPSSCCSCTDSIRRNSSL